MESAKYLFCVFKTINNCYLYDTNRNQFIEISESVFSKLQAVSHGTLLMDDAENSSDEIRVLKEKGYLADRHVQVIEHPYTSSVEVLLKRRLQKVTLQLTQNCNFRCSYCHYTSNDGGQRTHSNRRMSLELAKKAICFLRDHSIDTPEVYVGFYGGEPLLEFPMIKELVLFAEEELKGKTIAFTLTTNAVLLSDEIIQFFIQHDIDLLISLDGNREAHNKNRVFASNGKGTFDTIISKLKEISEKYPSFFKKITINMVMDPSVDFDEIDGIFTVYPFMKKIRVMSTIVDDVGASEKNVFSECFTFKNRYHTFLSYLCVLNRFPSRNVTRVFLGQEKRLKADLDTFSEYNGLPQKSAPSGPCVPGEVRLMVTVDGNFVLCERVSEISEPMIIGNINSGIDMQKVYKLLNIAQTTAEYCKNCWAFHLCSLCAKNSDKAGVLSSEERLSYCTVSKSHAKDLLEKAVLIKEMTEIYGQTTNF